MSPIRKKIEGGFQILEDQIDDFFDKFFRSTRNLRISSEPIWRPSIEIFDTEEKIYILVELAGVKKNDINVVLGEGMLKISGLRQPPHYPEPRRPRQMEIEYGRFERILRINESIEEDEVTVNYKNGILTIVLPKEKEAKPIKIKVEEET